MASDLVDIVISSWAPCLERLELLQATLHSLRGATLVPHRIIVADNGPVEQTEYIKTQCVDVHLVCPTNIGLGLARNLGASVSRSEYIVFSDNDIEYRRGWLQDSLQSMTDCKGSDVVVSPLRPYHLCAGEYIEGEINGHTLLNRCGTGCLLFRRSDFEKIGLWDASSNPGGEYAQKMERAGFRYSWRKTTESLAVHRGTRVERGKDAPRMGSREFWDKRWRVSVDKYLSKREPLFRHLRNKLRGRTADLGCGLTSAYRDGENVVGVDISGVAIQAMRHLSPAGMWRVGDARDTGLPCRSFDTVVLSHILEHYEEFGGLLREAKRIGKEGCRVVISVPKSMKDPDHVYPTWNKKTIQERIGPELDNLTYELVEGRWWIIQGENPGGRERNHSVL